MITAFLKSLLIATPFLMILFSYLPIGFLNSLCDFTWGYKGLDPECHPQAHLWASGFLLAGIIFEVIFRRGLLQALRQRFSTLKSFWIHLACLNIVFLGILSQYKVYSASPVWICFLIYENLLQIIWTLIFLITGFSSVSGLLHGLFNAYRFVYMNDIVGPFETLWFYSAASPAFYYLILGCALAAIGGLLFLYHKKYCISKPSISISSQCVWMGRCLYFFAAWTLLIKYILPVSCSIYRAEPLAQYIYFWDAWWIAHLFVGYRLIHQKKGSWKWAFLLAFVEIAIIVTKFIFYYKSPVLDFWHLNWYVNKWVMIVFFLYNLAWLIKPETRRSIK